ncbi:type II toxin-antitoxin system VapC family toxin [Burkholderia sp. Leaf177]|uniref:type II toxin-antitoxin system VapC family toxin n=1 Tax=Burkholderia sp. Leaf177 TaxID=1736287 RepID=UPI0009E67819|nr:type II toxin-antitoxin system VapC family toxin [Burkholderia sp. Leaf177]
MTQLYMLDTNICSFIMRKRPVEVLAKLQNCVNAQNRIVISAITYAEMRFGSVGKKASPKHAGLVSAFVARLDGVLPWDASAVDETTRIRVELASRGTPIGDNDSAIAGHALAAGTILVTNNVREFIRVPGLRIEDWATPAP